MIRVGIAGLGWWGRTLNKRLQASTTVNVTHGADPQVSASGKIEGLESLEIVDDLSKLLCRADLDGIIIATPHALHEARFLRRPATANTCFARSLSVWPRLELAAWSMPAARRASY